jgi:CxxC motif-containing protein (DUF1111 family)
MARSVLRSACIDAAPCVPLETNDFLTWVREEDMRTAITALTAAALVSSALYAGSADAQTNRRERFRARGTTQNEEPTAAEAARLPSRTFSEAPTGFDSLTNGFLLQGPEYDTLTEDTVVALRSFNDDRFIFEETETNEDGVGPVYNAQSCRECHQNVATGGASQVAEHRTGHLDGDVFFESLGGSLVHSRATHPDIVERVAYEDSIRTFRISTNTLGDGYVEAISNLAILAVRALQPAAMRGSIVPAPVLEAGGQVRIGRFGWKSQHASLKSFAADAYLNEMGITSPLFPEENSSSGINVGWGTTYDPVPDPEDDGVDVQAFADFMRSTKAPSRGPITPNVLAGETIFKNVGCGTCHTPTYTTSPPGTKINGGTFTLPAALGNKIIHPYSDFLVHDIGTGDGIPVQPTAEFAATAKQMRTAPLWGLRTRSRLMHDGLTFTEREAIERHAGQATAVTTRYKALSDADKTLLQAFLDSL